MIIVPRGGEHFPRVPEGEAKPLLVDPGDLPNSGDPETACKARDI